MKSKESLNIYYIIAPLNPKLPLKKPYQKFNSLEDVCILGRPVPLKDGLYCLSEYKRGKSKTQYDIYQITLDKLTGERLDNFLKAGLQSNSKTK